MYTALRTAWIVSGSGVAVEVAAAACFVAGTLVAAETGMKPIEEVQVGELVWARDPQTKEEGWKPVLQVQATPGKQVQELTFEAADGHREVVVATSDHPFWSLDDGGWDQAGHLDLGEVVDSQVGPMLLVESVPRPDRTTVYNFEVADSHTYFVGESGLWVHNNPTCFAVVNRAGRLINAFSGKFVTKQIANAATHIFGPKKVIGHRLTGVLASFGGDGIGATRALQAAGQAAARAEGAVGQYSAVVSLAGESITVRGFVVDGLFKISTAFIPIP